MIEIDWAREAADTVISLAGKYGRWLNARGKKLCFVIWNACTVYWMIRDFNLGLYSQSFFCLISIALNTYGYFNWKKKFEPKDGDCEKTS